MKGINFAKLSSYTFVLSVAFSILSLFLLIFKGLDFGIDFKGGIFLEISFNEVMPIERMRDIVSKVIKNYELQNLEKGRAFIIRSKGGEEELKEYRKKLEEIFIEKNINHIFERVEYVGPKISEFIVKQSFKAIALSLIAILLYIAFRFKSFIWGASGTIALIFDVLLTLGLISLLDIEVTVTIVAAVLILIGYSINDTVVVFDRIRENIHLLRKEKFENIMNIALNQVLKRTILTSLTTLFVLVVILLFGGAPIKDFSIVIIFGIIVGTFSSLFIASPIVNMYYKTKK